MHVSETGDSTARSRCSEQSGSEGRREVSGGGQGGRWGAVTVGVRGASEATRLSCRLVVTKPNK